MLIRNGATKGLAAKVGESMPDSRNIPRVDARENLVQPTIAPGAFSAPPDWSLAGRSLARAVGTSSVEKSFKKDAFLKRPRFGTPLHG
jgi:hypothetical protein